MYEIVVRYEDGHPVVVKHGVGDLGDACSLALTLANRLGEEPEDGSGPARAVEIRRDDRLEISVSVVRGGLVKPRDS